MKKQCVLLSSLILTCLFFSCSSTKKEVTSDYEVHDIISIESVDGGVIGDSKSIEKDIIAAPPEERVEASVEFTPPVILEDRVMTSEEMSYSDSEMLMAKESVDEVVVRDYPEGEIKRGGKRRVEEKQEQVSARLLTATEINDFKKWDEWGELLDEDFSSYLDIWGIVPRVKFTTKVVDKYGNPAVDAEVWLSNPQGDVEWYARTDNTGTAQLWADAISNAQSQGNIKRGQKKTVKYRIGTRHLTEVRTIENVQANGVNEIQMGTTSRPSRNVDIFFMVDATGSMGDELHCLQAELNDIIQRVERSQSGLSIRMGSLVYRDRGDDYVVRKSSFDKDISKTVSFLKKQRAGGGGDTPEAVDEALYQCVENETWSRDALARIAFLVLDAPPHHDKKSVQRVQEQVALAAKKGIRLIPLVASGMEQYGEYLMRSMALSTNGAYVALTDDSGIGNPHAKPTTSFYKVEKLNDLLVRLINEYTRKPLIEK